MSAQLSSFLRGTIPLDVLLLVALYLTLSRASGSSVRSRTPAGEPATAQLRRRLIAVSAIALATQGVHFAEEWATGFHLRFPALLGLAPWSIGLWAGFNLTWIAIWCLALVGLRLRWHSALFPIWFLGLGCAVNGVAHPLLALAAGGYFPGLWTSPLSGVVALFLLPSLARFTGPRATRRAAA